MKVIEKKRVKEITLHSKMKNVPSCKITTYQGFKIVNVSIKWDEYIATGVINVTHPSNTHTCMHAGIFTACKRRKFVTGTNN